MYRGLENTIQSLKTYIKHLILTFFSSSSSFFLPQELRNQCQKFATALLDHTRSSTELEILLNHDPTGPVYQHGERMHLNRLKLAIKYRQKKVGTFTIPRLSCALVNSYVKDEVLSPMPLELS